METGGITRCPYCMSPIEGKPTKSKLTPRQWNIYEAVVNAGPEGIESAKLIEEFLPGRNPVTLRSCIYSINQIINPQCLKGKGGRYYLDRVNWSEEKPDEGNGEHSG